jgi:Fuc2NAc and GlcNAc transferase
MSKLIICFSAFLISFLGTILARRYAILRNVLDIPNERSSHAIATPRGGGVAIVFSFLLSLLIAYENELVSVELLLGSWMGGGLVAVVGFLDDHGHISPKWRLLAHFAAAAVGLYLLPSPPQFLFWGTTHHIALMGYAFAALYAVWMLNLYNFMDGIDGLAGVQAVTVSLGACILYWACGRLDMIWAPTLLGLASLGFLCWNFPPARIFMGDAGSGFLGFQVALLSLHGATESSVIVWGWLIMMGCFIVDASFTLLRRLLGGERFYEAHRSHAYQFASRRLGSHKAVTLAIGALNLVWLLPIALLVVSGKLDPVVGILIAYAPLFLLALRFNAGKSE